MPLELEMWSTPPGCWSLWARGEERKELCVGRPCEGKIPTSNMALKQ